MMNFRISVSRSPMICLTVLALMVGSLPAQESDSAVQEPKAEAKLEISDVERQIARIEASGLDGAVQDSLKGKFSDVVDQLKDEEKSAQMASYFRDAMVVAPSDVIQIQRELEMMPSPEKAAKVDPLLGVEALRKALETARAELAMLSENLTKAEDELVRVRSRPVEIGVRLPAARIELADAEARLKSFSQGADDALPRIAERMMARATRQALAAEVEMLSQEQLSQAVREGRRLAQRDLLKRRRENKRALYASLGDRLKHQMVVDTKDLKDRIEALGTPGGKKDGDWEFRLQELRELVAELKSSGEHLDKVSSGHRDLENRRERVSQDYQRVQEQVKLGAVDGSFSQVLMRQLRRLPNPRPISGRIETRDDEVRDLMLSSYKVDEKQREQAVLAGQRDGNEEWQMLLGIREELLNKLRKNYGELVRESARLETDERAYRDLIVEFQKFLSAKLFWQRSSPLIGTSVLSDIPAAVRWSFSRENLSDFWDAVRSIPVRQPLPTWIAGLSVALLLVFRRRLIRSLEKSGKRIRKISTDRYAHTMRALMDSILLALPVPILTGYLAIGVLAHPEESDWVRGFGQGLLWSTMFLAWAIGLYEICRKGGLGEAHLNWNRNTCRLVQRVIVWLGITYTPMSLIASMMVYEESAKHFDSAGRLAFVLAHLSILAVVVFLINPSRGALSSHLDKQPDWLARTLHRLWYPLMMGVPLALVVLAGIGYVWTALVLSLEFHSTIRLLVSGMIVYGLLVRWFTIRQRRIALKEAIDARHARRDQAEMEEGQVENPELLEVTEDELQLDDVVAQTKRLLRVLVGIGTLILIWFMWSKTLPLDRESEAALTSDGLSWFSFLQLALLIPISITIVKNIPGLMDLAGLRSSGLDAGSRYALTTLCQYVITAVALAMVFNLLDLDWSQFGWIAAALSVGLGFGLQEVVANFVCGIIILFERPIRIGDVISLGEVTGTITRIRMRATTITDWDRKDFVVPNKEFITGSLMNWTLSSPVNRLVIPVGIAYGADTRAARQILLEVAEACPLVLEDPAPIAAFEEFADSTLNLTLRCYLPNMDNRLRTRTELCEAIDDRFKEAGIEIAFPQQDLHLRSVEPSILARNTPDSPSQA